jgi:hypothetical protein
VGLRATCYTSIPRDFFQCPTAASNYSQKNPTDKNLDFCFSKLLVVVGLVKYTLGTPHSISGRVGWQIGGRERFKIPQACVHTIQTMDFTESNNKHISSN